MTTYQCEHCGGVIENNYSSQTMQCPTCGAEMDRVDFAGQDTSADEASESEGEMSGI